MHVEISSRGIAVRNILWEQINEEKFRDKLENVAIPLIESELGMRFEGCQEYDHICQVLRIDFEDERLLPSSKFEAAEALSRRLTDEVFR